LSIISLHYKVPQRVLNRFGIINITKTIKYNYLDNGWYNTREDLFSVYTKDNIRIVMLGDSITEGVEWNELLGRGDIANRGISSDITEGFRNRLSDIIELKPQLCFIMGGINDINRGISIEVIMENIIEITKILKSHNIKIIMQSTLYMAGYWERNKIVEELNKRIEEYCNEEGLLFININKELANNGSLDKKYTYDGIHLNGYGYKKWSESIIEIMESN
jgi:lysophospholipase L1-like esterase